MEYTPPPHTLKKKLQRRLKREGYYFTTQSFHCFCLTLTFFTGKSDCLPPLVGFSLNMLCAGRLHRVLLFAGFGDGSSGAVEEAKRCLYC